MARPRKDDVKPAARDRLIAAFWELLETHTLQEISIGMVTKKAHCNRGTFYYHFENKDAMVVAAIEENLIDFGMLKHLFSVSASLQDYSLSSLLTDERMGRLALFVQQGGYNIVAKTVWNYVVKTWTAVLCPDGSELKEETQLIIRFMASGMLHMMAEIGDEGNKGHNIVPPAVFISDCSKTAMKHIMRAQGISDEEFQMRLQMYSQLSDLMNK